MRYELWSWNQDNSHTLLSKHLSHKGAARARDRANSFYHDAQDLYRMLYITEPWYKVRISNLQKFFY